MNDLSVLPTYQLLERLGIANLNQEQFNFLSDLGLRMDLNLLAHHVDCINDLPSNQVLDALQQMEHHDLFCRLILMLNIEKIDNPERFIEKDSLVHEIDANVNDLLKAVQYYVNQAGSWKDGKLIVDNIFMNHRHSIVSEKHYHILLMYCANILAVHDDVRCFDLFSEAREVMKSGYDRFSCMYRMLVFAAKKTHIVSGEKYLEIRESINDKLKDNFFGLTSSERGLCHGMLKNLNALHLFKEGYSEAALEEIELAQSVMQEVMQSTGAGDDNLNDLVHRYYVQILGNHNMLLCEMGDLHKALEIGEKSLEFSQGYHEESILESMSILSYNLIILNKNKNALGILQNAIFLLDYKFPFLFLNKKGILEMLLVSLSELNENVDEILLKLDKIGKVEDLIERY